MDLRTGPEQGRLREWYHGAGSQSSIARQDFPIFPLIRPKAYGTMIPPRIFNRDYTMKPPVLLRIASVLTFIHAVLHTMGGVFGKTPPGPASVAMAAMRANQFAFMGAMRTYWDFQRGLGLAVTIFLTMEAIVFWLLASLAKRNGTGLRPVLAIFALGYLAFAVDSMAYFFTMAAVMEAVIATLLFWAAVKCTAAA